MFKNPQRSFMASTSKCVLHGDFVCERCGFGPSSLTATLAMALPNTPIYLGATTSTIHWGQGVSFDTVVECYLGSSCFESAPCLASNVAHSLYRSQEPGQIPCHTFQIFSSRQLVSPYHSALSEIGGIPQFRGGFSARRTRAECSLCIPGQRLQVPQRTA